MISISLSNNIVASEFSNDYFKDYVLKSNTWNLDVSGTPGASIWRESEMQEDE